MPNRRFYTVVILFLCLALVGCGKSGLPETRPPREEIPTQYTTDTVIHEFVYTDASGYLLPTARRVPRGDDPTTLLQRLLNNEDNKTFFENTGLKSAFQTGFGLEATCANGQAVVNITGDWTSLSVADERNMVRAVVTTTLGLPNIEAVKLTFNGKALSALQHQTTVSGSFRAPILNVDTSVFSDTDRGSAVTVYFASPDVEFLVPVSRYLQNEGTLQVALSQLCAGPSSSSKLHNTLPAGTAVRYTKVEDGVATINFSSAFNEILSQPDGGAAALRAVMLTAKQFENVNDVLITVEEVPFESDWNVAAMVYVNEY